MDGGAGRDRRFIDYVALGGASSTSQVCWRPGARKPLTTTDPNTTAPAKLKPMTDRNVRTIGRAKPDVGGRPGGAAAQRDAERR